MHLNRLKGAEHYVLDTFKLWFCCDCCSSIQIAADSLFWLHVNNLWFFFSVLELQLLSFFSLGGL